MNDNDRLPVWIRVSLNAFLRMMTNPTILTHSIRPMRMPSHNTILSRRAIQDLKSFPLAAALEIKYKKRVGRRHKILQKKIKIKTGCPIIGACLTQSLKKEQQSQLSPSKGDRLWRPTWFLVTFRVALESLSFFCSSLPSLSFQNDCKDDH